MSPFSELLIHFLRSCNSNRRPIRYRKGMQREQREPPSLPRETPAATPMRPNERSRRTLPAEVPCEHTCEKLAPHDEEGTRWTEIFVAMLGATLIVLALAL